MRCEKPGVIRVKNEPRSSDSFCLLEIALQKIDPPQIVVASPTFAVPTQKLLKILFRADEISRIPPDQASHVECSFKLRMNGKLFVDECGGSRKIPPQKCKTAKLVTRTQHVMVKSNGPHVGRIRDRQIVALFVEVRISYLK